MIEALRGILGAVVCGDFLLAFILLALMALLKQRKTPEIPSGTEAAPETEEARRVREAREDAEAWRRLQNYGVPDAYGRNSA